MLETVDLVDAKEESPGLNVLEGRFFLCSEDVDNVVSSAKARGSITSRE